MEEEEEEERDWKEDARKVGEGFEGVGVFSRRVVESVSGLEPNAGEDRTPRKETRDRRSRRCTLLGDYRRSIAR